MGRAGRQIREIVPLSIIVVAGLLGACGSGAIEGPELGDEGLAADHQGSPSGSEGGDPDERDSTSSGSGGGGRGNGSAPSGGGDDDEGDGAEEYTWGLPEGPTSPDDTFEDDVYVLLAAGSCAEAQSKLDGVWVQLKSARGVLLYQAAVHFCAGERTAGQQRFNQASGYGWLGVDWVAPTDKGGFRFDCEVYKSISSVLEQRARDSINCLGGDGPTWPDPRYWEPGTRDDPRTPEDESKTPAPTDEPTKPPTEPPTEPPTDESPTAAPLTDG